MKVYRYEVKRNPWASEVTVSRTRNGRWIIQSQFGGMELPANTFTSWDYAEWTANNWVNEEYELRNNAA
jgi:hypothetical protein